MFFYLNYIYRILKLRLLYYYDNINSLVMDTQIINQYFNLFKLL